ncbi:hypothetical protein, partial [Desulfovibrio sp.]|uniref:hypothetical protein n=1 Tax=Desulfovibrio sp. TaxID=885 RepID=UPI003D12ADEE
APQRGVDSAANRNLRQNDTLKCEVFQSYSGLDTGNFEKVTGLYRCARVQRATTWRGFCRKSQFAAE